MSPCLTLTCAQDTWTHWLWYFGGAPKGQRTYTCTHMHTYAHMHARMLARTHTCSCTRAHACAHKYTCMCAHAHTDILRRGPCRCTDARAAHACSFLAPKDYVWAHMAACSCLIPSFTCGHTWPGWLAAHCRAGPTTPGPAGMGQWPVGPEPWPRLAGGLLWRELARPCAFQVCLRTPGVFGLCA